MDQVKTYLAVLKKHHFWPLAVLIIGVGIYAWNAGKKHYDAMYASDSSKLTKSFSDAQGVSSINPHPNQFFIDEVKKINTAQRADVKAAWQRLYDNQKQVLTWEPEFADIAKLKADQEIPAKLRDTYWNYSKYQVPKLFQRIDIRETVNTEPTAAGGAAAPVATEGGEPVADAPAEEPDGTRKLGEAKKETGPVLKGTVVWPQSERDRIMSKYTWPRQPRAKQIRYAQEDYWVYTALLDIINQANAGVKDPGSVAIKKIETLDLAQGVPPANNAAFPVPTGTVTAVEAPPPSRAGAKASQAGPTDEELDNGRYVSAEGAPMPAPDPAAQFKLIPIRMRLIMDQRKLPDLLVACANSPLPVEVRQVQLNVRENESRGGGGGGGGGGRRLGGGGGGGPAPAAVAAPAAGAKAAQFDPWVVQTPFDQRIEIRGLIYIFNPVDLAALGEEVPAEASAEEPAADAETTENAAEAPAEGEAAAEEPAADAKGTPEESKAEEAAPAAGTEEPSAEAPAGEAPAGEAAPEAAPPADGEPAAEPAPAEPAAAEEPAAAPS